jgi:hypothetical protein
MFTPTLKDYRLSHNQFFRCKLEALCTFSGVLQDLFAIDRARQKGSRNLRTASAQRRLEPACLSEKAGNGFFSMD